MNPVKVMYYTFSAQHAIFHDNGSFIMQSENNQTLKKFILYKEYEKMV